MSGCSGIWADRAHYRQTGELLRKREYGRIIQTTEKKKTKLYKPKNRVLEYLDLGMLYHYSGDYGKSNDLLEKAELAMEELYTKSLSRAAMSMLLNDNVLEYPGEDFEDIYANVFKALNYLHLDSFDDAYVEIRRINFKLDLLEDKYGQMVDSLNTSKDKRAEFKAGANKFHSSALGRYLSMLIYEQEGRTDDAYIDYVKFYQAYDQQPDIYGFSPPQLADPTQPQSLPSLHILALTGRSPRKLHREFHIATAEDEIHVVTLDRDILPLSFYWPGIDPHLYFKFVVPYLDYEPSGIDRVTVRVDSVSYDLSLIEDIGRVAEQTFKVKEPLLILKNATRSILKGVAANALKKEFTKKDDIGGGLLSLGTDIALLLSEKPDLRCSRFFPGLVLAADIPVAPGQHRVRIDYFDHQGYLLHTDDRGWVQIKPDQLNLIESWQLE